VIEAKELAEKSVDKLCEDTIDLLGTVLKKHTIAFIEVAAELRAENNKLKRSLRELIDLAEIGDADQDEHNWHPALEAARSLVPKA
jgi:hypothetical protein